MVSPNGRPTDSPPTRPDRLIWALAASYRTPELGKNDQLVLMFYAAHPKPCYWADDKIGRCLRMPGTSVSTAHAKLVNAGLLLRDAKKGRATTHRLNLATNVLSSSNLTALSTLVDTSIEQLEPYVLSSSNPCIEQLETKGEGKGEGEGGHFPSPEREINPSPPPSSSSSLSLPLPGNKD